ncbi:hypothetical protein [Mycobacterium haemophilum]|uniref:Uncharacterized protein n=1 Tax=Mycobacterium haemophilum TaxID=29311 RepID=A0A0I9UJC3_9MYCO|nr:hypothetical protein [Mycobacterium haemophilum]AKN17069.1 hypothetical protein B586_11715 [Mycobacterium haemophilum DSM 44634]KLO32625.1 hypothetical protein ABH39_06000 [Mycobacterium haemophilum]KLO36886.1 hypothetical protein ABH38_10845 [Mycobacterium haemophilum]KLO42906.1 hypothetical protein ABH37_09470 [Mycobacterium haemophilum]KLO55719.1 hypothetical protein ABH36_04975 [Mycobacterium haemophilum]
MGLHTENHATKPVACERTTTVINIENETMPPSRRTSTASEITHPDEYSPGNLWKLNARSLKWLLAAIAARVA